MLRPRNVYFAGTALLVIATATDSLVGALVVSGVSLIIYSIAAMAAEVG